MERQRRPRYGLLFQMGGKLPSYGIRVSLIQFVSRDLRFLPMNTSSCLNVINFTSHGVYINPARFSPLNVRIRSVTASKSRYYLYTEDRRPAMCISSVLCNDSHVLAPPPIRDSPRNGLPGCSTHKSGRGLWAFWVQRLVTRFFVLN